MNREFKFIAQKSPVGQWAGKWAIVARQRDNTPGCHVGSLSKETAAKVRKQQIEREDANDNPIVIEQVHVTVFVADVNQAWDAAKEVFAKEVGELTFIF